MTKYTNHTQGLRGLRTEDGVVHWVEAGASIELDKVVKPLPDLGKATNTPAGDDELARLRAENDQLRAQVAGGSKAAAATADDIKSAVSMLDAKDDKHWTQAGLPEVAAIAELTGKTVTRKAIEEAAPDAKRPTE